MSDAIRSEKSTDPKDAFEGRPWVVEYDSNAERDAASILVALEELERLMAIGLTPSLLIGDGERRIAIGRRGWRRWKDLIAPMTGSRSPAYARVTSRSTFLAWKCDDVTWNVRFEIDTEGTLPSMATAIDELRRRMSLFRSVVEAAASPGEVESWRSVSSARFAVMAAAAIQAEQSGRIAWTYHQDETVMGGMGGVRGIYEVHEDSLGLSDEGRTALRALPSVLRIEHRTGKHLEGSRRVESVIIYAPVTLCTDPGDPMERLRALTIIPEGETWWAA